LLTEISNELIKQLRSEEGLLIKKGDELGYLNALTHI
jgi:hypothetical protein